MTLPEAVILLLAGYWFYRGVILFVKYSDRVLETIEKQEDE